MILRVNKVVNGHNQKIFFSEEDLNSELPETQGNQVKTNVEVDSVKNGTFLLAEFKGTQKNTSYRYLCVAESEVEEDGEVRVMCLKCLDSTRKNFFQMKMTSLILDLNRY